MIELSDADRQATILALAHLAVERPGWLTYLRGIARALGDADGLMFDRLRTMHAETVKT